MPAEQTASDSMTLGMGIVGLAVLIIIVFAILKYLFDKKKGFKDDLKEIALEMKKDSKINCPSNLSQLFRVPLPSPGEFLRSVNLAVEDPKVSDFGRIENTAEDLFERIKGVFDDTIRSQHSASVFLGDIVGYNEINMLAALEDIIVPSSDKDEDILVNVTEKERKEVRDILIRCGNFLIVITYVPKKTKLLSLDQEEILLCWRDQVSGLHSADNKLYVYGQGTDKIAIHFSIVSDFSDRVKPTLTYLIDRGWIRLAMRHQSMLSSIAQEAMQSDSGYQKALLTAAILGTNRDHEKDKK